MKQYKILIVEDEALVAAMIREAIESDKFKVIHTAFNQAQALDHLKNAKFDAVLLDINLNGNFEGIQLGQTIHDIYKIPFLYLTAHADDKTINNAKRTQPSGYIVKPFTDKDVKVGLEIALYNFEKNKATPLEEPDWSLINQNLPEPLSQREIDMLRLIYKGKSNKEMANSLFVSTNTVKTHLRRLYARFDVSSRTEALAHLRDLVSRY